MRWLRAKLRAWLGIDQFESLTIKNCDNLSSTVREAIRDHRDYSTNLWVNHLAEHADARKFVIEQIAETMRAHGHWHEEIQSQWMGRFAQLELQVSEARSVIENRPEASFVQAIDLLSSEIASLKRQVRSLQGKRVREVAENVTATEASALPGTEDWCGTVNGGQLHCEHVWRDPEWAHPMAVVGGRHIDRECSRCLASQCGVFRYIEQPV